MIPVVRALVPTLVFPRAQSSWTRNPLPAAPVLFHIPQLVVVQILRCRRQRPRQPFQFLAGNTPSRPSLDGLEFAGRNQLAQERHRQPAVLRGLRHGQEYAPLNGHDGGRDLRLQERQECRLHATKRATTHRSALRLNNAGQGNRLSLSHLHPHPYVEVYIGALNNGMMHQKALWLELAMAIGLLAGAGLARLRRFTAHGWLQGTIVTANVLIIAVVMIPAFYRDFGATRVVLVHAIAGSIAELLGLYVVLSAGLGWLPARFRFQNYKPWMRLTLATWLVAVGLGAWTYQTLNGGSAAPSPPASPSTTRITVKNFAFDPPELTVPAGTEVEWTDATGRHTVQADDGSFKSDTLTAGGSFKHRFDKPGVYRYFCEFHGAAGGHGMAGVVNVR